MRLIPIEIHLLLVGCGGVVAVVLVLCGDGYVGSDTVLCPSCQSIRDVVSRIASY